MEAFVNRIIAYIRRFFREFLHYRAEDLPYYLTIVIALVVFVLAMNGFVDLTEELADNNLGAFDQRVTEELLSWRSDSLTRFLTFVTEVGDSMGYVVVIAFLVLLFVVRQRNWKFILQTVAVLLLATLSNMALKEVINRSRPTIEHLVTVYTLSYPSGHAMSAMGFYGFLIFLTARYKMNYFLKAALVSLLAVLILLIGISRIYLGVHFPSDVLAGFIGGLIWVTFCAIVFDIIDLMRKRQQRMKELVNLNESGARRKHKDEQKNTL